MTFVLNSNFKTFLFFKYIYILVFFVFLTVKINGGVQIMTN